jgi:hypothetical protein
MNMRNDAAGKVTKVRDTLVGLATAGALVSGWSKGQAALLGLKAEESATARIAAGEKFESAFGSAILEAELILMLDVFSRALDETRDVAAAFDRVLAIKRSATKDAPGAEVALKVADGVFRDALKGGLSPHTALASAYCSAAATARLASVARS